MIRTLLDFGPIAPNNCVSFLDETAPDRCTQWVGDEAWPMSIPLVREKGVHGYHFRILTRQGRNTPGGTFSYIINGRMLAGFAMVAYPAEYGTTGVMTFIVNNNGVIYQKDRGSSPQSITEFNPDESWKRVDEP